MRVWVSPSVILHWKDKKTKARKYLAKRQIVECITRASETRPQQIAELYEEVIAEDKDRDDQLKIQEMKSVYERGRSRPLDAESNVLFEENIGGRRKRQKVHVTPAGRRGKFFARGSAGSQMSPDQQHVCRRLREWLRCSTERSARCRR